MYAASLAYLNGSDLSLTATAISSQHACTEKAISPQGFESHYTFVFAEWPLFTENETLLSFKLVLMALCITLSGFFTGVIH